MSNLQIIHNDKYEVEDMPYRTICLDFLNDRERNGNEQNLFINNVVVKDNSNDTINVLTYLSYAI